MWHSPAQLWQRKPAIIAALAGIVTHLTLRFAFHAEPATCRLPLLITLIGGGVRLVALRCAGFNNVDLAAAKELRLPVVRVPAYSPHAVAEHCRSGVASLAAQPLCGKIDRL